MTRRPVVPLVVAVVSAALLALPGTTPTPAAASTSGTSHATVVVPITVQYGQGTPTGARPDVRVGVGRNKALPMLLDTGSVGLHVLAPAIRTGPGSGVTITTRPDSITYTSGIVFTGVVAYGVVAVGSQATSVPVAFGLIQHVSCTAAKPHCPTAGGIDAAVAGGKYGTLGVGMDSSLQGVLSPILGMPGALGRTWSVHVHGVSGTLTLGAPVPTGPTVAESIPLVAEGTAGPPSAARLWDDKAVPLCMTVGTTGACMDVLFDSGAAAMQLRGSPFDQVRTVRGVVAPGTKVGLSVAGARQPFWTFVTGTTKSKNTATVRPSGTAFVNTGVQAFYTFTITYDAVAGTLTLTR